MRPHLPLKLTAYVLATVIGANAQTQGAESISIDFGANHYTITPGNSAGCELIEEQYWNKLHGASGANQTLIDNNSDEVGIITWSSPGTWSAGWWNNTGHQMINHGYLDDNGGDISINVTGLDYLLYDVYIYCNSDNASAFTSKNVNGVDYSASSDRAVAGSTSGWGTGSNASSLEMNLGVNTLRVQDLSGDLSIVSKRNGSVRGSIAGLQIVATYTGTETVANIAQGNSDWTSTTLGDQSWNDATAAEGKAATLTLTGDSSLTIAEGETRSVGILNTSGGNLTVSGGTLDLDGRGILHSDDGHDIVINSAVTGFASVNSNVTFNGDVNITGIAGTGTIRFGENSTLTVTGETPSSFSGSLTMSVSQYAANDSWAHTASTLNITGDGDLNVSLENGTLGTINRDESASGSVTVTKTTNDIAYIGSNNLSSVNHLDIQAGTIELNHNDRYSSIESVKIGNNSALKLRQTTTHIGAEGQVVSIEMAAGSLLGVYNGYSGAATNVNITVNAKDSQATIAGSYYGNNTNIAGSITGEGTLLLTNISDTSDIAQWGPNPYRISAVISDKSESAPLSVVIDGNGSGYVPNITLSGYNTYTGNTIVRGGTLNLDADHALGSGAWAYVAGGTLNANNHTIANNLVFEAGLAQNFANFSNAIWAMNNAGASTLKNSSLSGAVLNVQRGNDQTLTFDNVSGTLSGIIFDMSTVSEGAQIILTNNTSLDLSGLSEIKLNLSDAVLADLSTATTFTLFSLENGSSLTGVSDWNDIFKLYNNGTLVDLNTLNLMAQYDTGNLTFALIPEPSTASLGLLGLTALLMRRRRR